MAFLDEFQFKMDNIDGLKRAAELAPKLVRATILREFDREAAKFKTAYRKAFLFGSPGINVPKRNLSLTKTGKPRFKKRTNADAKTIQLRHVRTKVFGSGGERRVAAYFVAYLSHFLGFHASKLEAGFKTQFRAVAPRLKTRLAREAARITQAVLDKGLRDARGGRR